jgi:hypothetical protein
MLYSEIKNHVINKSIFWAYGVIIFISLIIGYLACINKGEIVFSYSRGNIFTLLIFYLSIMAICCILINLYRCQNFYKVYNDFLKEYDAQFNKIIIEKEAYNMPVPYKSYNATIHPSPKQTNTVFIETDDFLLLFFSIQYFGLFQLVLKPFVFIKTDKKINLKYKNMKIIRDFKTVKTEENRMIIFPNKYGIKKVIIPIGSVPSCTCSKKGEKNINY